MAVSAKAGEKAPAKVAWFPAATTTVIPASVAFLTAKLTLELYRPPADRLMTLLSAIPFAMASLIA
jgi:hypothetical protein